MAFGEHRNHYASRKRFEISGYSECKHFLQKQLCYKLWSRLGMAIIFLPSGGRSMVPLSLQHISYFWVLISETDDCPGSCFWALLPKVLWTLAHPRRENHRLFIQINSFQEQKSFWGFTNSFTSLGARVHSCCLVLGLCSRAVFQLQERHSGPCCPNIL